MDDTPIDYDPESIIAEQSDRIAKLCIDYTTLQYQLDDAMKLESELAAARAENERLRGSMTKTVLLTGSADEHEGMQKHIDLLEDENRRLRAFVAANDMWTESEDFPMLNAAYVAMLDRRAALEPPRQPAGTEPQTDAADTRE